MNPNRQSDISERAPAIQPDQPSTLAHILLNRASWGQSVLSPWLQRWFKPGARSTTGLETTLKRRFLPALTTIQTKVLPGRSQHPVDQTPLQWPTRGILNPGRLDRFTNIIVNRFPVTKSKYERYQLEFRQADSLPLILAGLETEETPGDSEERGAESFESMLARAESFESMLAKTGQAQQVIKKSGSVEAPPPTPSPQPAQIQRTSSRFETMLSRVKQGSVRSSRPDVSPPIASQAPQAEARHQNDELPPPAISKRAFSRIEELSSSDQTSLVPEVKPNAPITHKLEPPSVEESPPVGPVGAKPVVEPESSPAIAPMVQRQPTPEGPPPKSFDPAEASPAKGIGLEKSVSKAEPNQVVESPKQQQLQPETIRPEPTAQSSQTEETSFEENDVKESSGDLESSPIVTPKVQRGSPSEMSQRALPAPPLAVDEPTVEETRLVKPAQEPVQRPSKPEISFHEAPEAPERSGPIEEQATEGTTIIEPAPEPVAQRSPEPGILLREEPVLPGPTEEQATEGTTIVEPAAEPVAQRPPEPEILLREEPVLPGPTEEQATEGTTIAEPGPKPAIQRGLEPEMPQREPATPNMTAAPSAKVADSSEPLLEPDSSMREEAIPLAGQSRPEMVPVQRSMLADQKRDMPLRLQPVQEIESGQEEKQSQETQSPEPDEPRVEPDQMILAKAASKWHRPLTISTQVIPHDSSEGRSTNQMAVLPQVRVPALAAKTDRIKVSDEMPTLEARLPHPALQNMKSTTPSGPKAGGDLSTPVTALPPLPTVQRQQTEPVTASPAETPPGVIQRANGISDQPTIQPALEESAPDLDNLARQVYPLIKRMLAVEQQRRLSR